MLLLEFENTTENQVYIRTSDISINDLVVTEGYWDSDAVNAGKHAIIEIDLTSALKKEFWDMLGISDVGMISLSVMQRDSEDNDLNIAKWHINVNNYDFISILNEYEKTDSCFHLPFRMLSASCQL